MDSSTPASHGLAIFPIIMEFSLPLLESSRVVEVIEAAEVIL
jgi:hypothetical protein